jgi:DUF1680 family protein
MQTYDGDLAIVIDDEAFGMDSAEPTTTGTAALCATVAIIEGN